MIETNATKQRLDTWLAVTYPSVSRSTWQKHIKAGRVMINNAVDYSPKTEVTPTDTITTQLPSEPDFSNQTLPIIYQDNDVIVINKPAGILTHAKGALTDEFTVADFFKRYTTYGLTTNRPGIVHRLDRDTSGVLIGARTPEAAQWLQKQFSQRKVKKTYIAVTQNTPKQAEAIIELPIERNPKTPSTFRAGTNGKPAITHYFVIASNGPYGLIKLQPVTGRTHQLRVHLKHLGTPIVGDRVYGASSDRLYLHAYQLEITLPNCQRTVFTAPIPAEFKAKFPEVTSDEPSF